MKTIAVAYERRGPAARAADAKLVTAIESYGEVVQPLSSLWLLRTDLGPRQVRDYLERLVDPSDRLIVCDVTGADASWRGLDDEAVEWIAATP